MGNWLDEYFEEEKEKEEISNIKRNKETLPNFDSADEMIKLWMNFNYWKRIVDSSISL